MVSGFVEEPKLEPEPERELAVREEPRGLRCAGGLREEDDEVPVAICLRPSHADLL